MKRISYYRKFFIITKSIYYNIIFTNNKFKTLFPERFIDSLRCMLNKYGKDNEKIKYYLFIEEYLEVISILKGILFSERSEELYTTLLRNLSLSNDQVTFIYILASEKKVKIFFPKISRNLMMADLDLGEYSLLDFKREVIYFLNENLMNLSEETQFYEVLKSEF